MTMRAGWQPYGNELWERRTCPALGGLPVCQQVWSAAYDLFFAAERSEAAH